MQDQGDIPIGDRIRFHRQARRKTQVVVAGLAGITEDYLSQIERGLKTPSTALLHQLARILAVPTSALFGESPVAGATPGHPLSTAIHSALMTDGQVPGDAAPRLPSLRERLDAAWQIWHGSPRRYSEAGPLLPGLISDVEGAVGGLRSSADPVARREAAAIAADLYFLLRTFTKRLGRTDLALLVADRGLRAAQDADDPLRIAAATWNLGQVLLATNEAGVAEEVCIRAAWALEPELDRNLDAAALIGALWLVAVIAAARCGDAWAARDRLREQARPVAARTGEGNVFWTVFGPTNVALHAVSVAMETGESAEALRLADEVDVTRCPSVERRATFALEVARCYDLRHEDAGVLLNLLAAEREAPEDMRHNVLARDLVRGLLRRARPSMGLQVRELAARIELFD
jgi:transcriptional regulator with XRE-family HTH domain